MDERVVEVLQRAKEKVAEGWCQEALAVFPDFTTMPDGPATPTELASAVEVCASGAIQSQVGACGFVSDAAFHFLELAIGCCGVAVWNDASDRTHVDVLDAFDRAIRLAKDATA